MTPERLARLLMAGFGETISDCLRDTEKPRVLWSGSPNAGLRNRQWLTEELASWWVSASTAEVDRHGLGDLRYNEVVELLNNLPASTWRRAWNTITREEKDK